MSVRIIIDSTADLPHGAKENFLTVPLTIHFGQEEYIDGVTITHHQFYEKLIESDTLPTTSQATPAAFGQAFRQIVDNGDTAVVITVSSELSGTCQSADIAAADFPDRIYVVDSTSVALGAGILAQLALQLAASGLTAAQIAARLEQERSHIRLIALLDTLEYLKRGGRISKAAAIAGSLINIKPVIGIRNGVIEVLGKARGSRQGNNLLVREIQQSGGIDFSRPLLLGYTGISDALLQKYIADSASLWQDHLSALPQTVIGSVVGTHAGPGAVAVAFFAP